MSTELGLTDNVEKTTSVVVTGDTKKQCLLMES